MRLREFLVLSEAAEGTSNELTVRDAADLWSELSDAATTYIASTVFLVKFDETKKVYSVYKDENSRLKLYTTMPKAEFDDAFELLNKSAKPDAEGYMKYRLSDKIEAVPFNGEPTLVTVEGKDIKLSRGDYLTRTVSGKSFIYAIENGAFFKRTFTKA